MYKTVLYMKVNGDVSYDIAFIIGIYIKIYIAK